MTDEEKKQQSDFLKELAAGEPGIAAALKAEQEFCRDPEQMRAYFKEEMAQQGVTLSDDEIETFTDKDGYITIHVKLTDDYVRIRPRCDL